MRKSKPLQLLLEFAESPQGDERSTVPDASRAENRSVHASESSQGKELTPPPAADNCRLLELVAAPDNLASALAKVVSNKGAPGVDRQTVEEIERHGDELLPKLKRALLTETYVPGDVRRVWIPKPGGGQRGLGIPNVVDRLVQQAVLQVLEPIYEPTFHPSSHGFRPGRGAQTAIAEACGHIRTGLSYTVDLDLEKFFDRVNHQRLLDRLGQKVHDSRLLRIIRLMLKAKVVLPDGTRVSTEEGTPQGGPLSPLLSNVVLDELDRELSRRGLRFVRYADDCNIYVGSKRAGERVMGSVRKFIEGRLRLKVNEAKSAVDLTSNRHFLGFRLGTIQGDKIFVRLSKRSHQRIYERFRELTPRNWGGRLDTCIERVNQYVVGWTAYFRLCTSGVSRQLKQFDAHVRRRLRAIIVRQKKRPRHLFRHLRGRGVSKASAWTSSFSRLGPWWQSNSGGMHKAYPNHWFDERVVSFEEQWRKIRFDWRTHFGMAS